MEQTVILGRSAFSKEETGMKKVSEQWGEVVTEEEAAPVLYHFRPTRYVKVAPQRLRDWEAYFVKNVGLSPDSKASLVEGRSATMSGSYDCWDDADYV
jgi:hypothetical protein